MEFILIIISLTGGISTERVRDIEECHYLASQIQTLSAAAMPEESRPGLSWKCVEVNKLS